MAETGYSRETIDARFNIVDEKVKVANHRIDDLEIGMKETQQLVTAMTAIDKKVDILSTEVSHTFGEIKKDNEAMKQDIASTAANIKEINGAPLRIFQKLIWLVIGAAVSGGGAVIVWFIQTR